MQKICNTLFDTACSAYHSAKPDDFTEVPLAVATTVAGIFNIPSLAVIGATCYVGRKLLVGAKRIKINSEPVEAVFQANIDKTVIKKPERAQGFFILKHLSLPENEIAGVQKPDLILHADNQQSLASELQKSLEDLKFVRESLTVANNALKKLESDFDKLKVLNIIIKLNIDYETVRAFALDDLVIWVEDINDTQAKDRFLFLTFLNIHNSIKKECFSFINRFNSIKTACLYTNQLNKIDRENASKLIKTLSDLSDEEYKSFGIDYYSLLYIDDPTEFAIGRALETDRPQILRKLYDLNEIGPHKHPADKLLNRAANERAVECLNEILRRPDIDFETRNQAYKKALNFSSLAVAVTLNRNMEQVVRDYFETQDNAATPHHNQIKTKFRQLFRYNSIEISDRVAEVFLKLIPDSQEKNSIQRIFQQERLEAFRLLPFISQYVKENDIADLKKTYYSTSEAEQTDIEADLSYASKCCDLTMQFVCQLQGNSILAPQTPDYSQLPPSKKGTRRFAALLEKIGEFRNSARAGNKVGLKMDGYSTTPQQGRYRWGQILRRELVGSDLENNRNYSLFFQGVKLTEVFSASWMHGLAPLNKTWQWVEDTFEDIMSMQLKKGGKVQKEEMDLFL